jgi:hypothetical protein
LETEELLVGLQEMRIKENRRNRRKARFIGTEL